MPLVAPLLPRIRRAGDLSFRIKCIHGRARRYSGSARNA